MYLVVPYFPPWGNSRLVSAIRRLNKVWSSMVGAPIRVSWRLGASHLVSRVKVFNSRIAFYGLDVKAVLA